MPAADRVAFPAAQRRERPRRMSANGTLPKSLNKRSMSDDGRIPDVANAVLLLPITRIVGSNGFHSITSVVSSVGSLAANQLADFGLCANGASAPLLFGRVSPFPDIVRPARLLYPILRRAQLMQKTSARRSSAYLLIFLGNDSGSLHHLKNSRSCCVELINARLRC